MLEVSDRSMEEMKIKQQIMDKRLEEIKMMLDAMDNRMEVMENKLDAVVRWLRQVVANIDDRTSLLEQRMGSAECRVAAPEPTEGEEISEKSTPAGVKNQSPNNHGAEGATSGLGMAPQQILYTILPLSCRNRSTPITRSRGIVKYIRILGKTCFMIIEKCKEIPRP